MTSMSMRQHMLPEIRCWSPTHQMLVFCPAGGSPIKEFLSHNLEISREVGHTLIRVLPAIPGCYISAFHEDNGYVTML